MMRTLIALGAAALLWTAAAPAYAGEPDQATITEAQGYYEKGDTAYNLGRFDEAVEWFTKAYETWPIPDFLYNIAQSYRQSGNCKQALYFYKRYKSLKDKDKKSPLTKKEKAEVERFISEATECAAKADDTATTPPDSLKGGGDTDTDTTTDTDSHTTTDTDSHTTTDTTNPTTTDTTDTTDTTTDGDQVATTQDPDGDDEEENPSVEQGITVPKLLSVHVLAGIAKVGASDISVPVQPAFSLGAGYPIAAGPVVLDIGAGLSYTPMPYDLQMGGTASGSLLGIRAAVGGTYPVNDKIGVRGELGLGMASLGGLVQGNPYTLDRSPGSFTMFNLRVGVAAEYAITKNIVATLSPITFGFSPAPSTAYMSSLTEIDVELGVGYRM